MRCRNQLEGDAGLPGNILVHQWRHYCRWWRSGTRCDHNYIYFHDLVAIL